MVNEKYEISNSCVTGEEIRTAEDAKFEEIKDDVPVKEPIIKTVSFEQKRIIIIGTEEKRHYHTKLKLGSIDEIGLQLLQKIELDGKRFDFNTCLEMLTDVLEDILKTPTHKLIDENANQLNRGELNKKINSLKSEIEKLRDL